MLKKPSHIGSATVLGMLAVLIVITPARATAEPDDEGRANLNALLRGDYAITQSRECVESSAGFDPVTLQLNPRPPLPAPFVFRRVAYSNRGVIHYNGDGTAQATVRTLGIELFTGPGGFPASESDNICEIRYTVNPDLSVDQFASCRFQAGAATGTVVGLHGQHQIVQGGKLLLLSAANQPSIETVSLDNPLIPSRERICTSTGTGAKLPNEQGEE